MGIRLRFAGILRGRSLQDFFEIARYRVDPKCLARRAEAGGRLKTGAGDLLPFNENGQVERQTLATVIRRNTEIRSEVQDNPFRVEPRRP